MQVNVRIDAATHALWMEQAEREGISLSALIRKRMAVEPLEPSADVLVGPLVAALNDVLGDLDARIAREVVERLRER